MRLTNTTTQGFSPFSIEVQTEDDLQFLFQLMGNSSSSQLCEIINSHLNDDDARVLTEGDVRRIQDDLFTITENKINEAFE